MIDITTYNKCLFGFKKVLYRILGLVCYYTIFGVLYTLLKVKKSASPVTSEHSVTICYYKQNLPTTPSLPSGNPYLVKVLGKTTPSTSRH